jgi:hypothetical protein
MFDIVVQNGGFRSGHGSEFERYKRRHPKASEEELLLELLEIRVQSSKPQWRGDVRSRKKAVILGEGRVHGRDRVLQEEHCYDQVWPMGQILSY